MPDMTPTADTNAPRTVAWSRVALFYGIAFGLVAILGLVFWFRGVDMTYGAPALVYQLTVAFLYMPMPLVAGLIVERVAGRPALIRRTFRDFRHRWWRVVLISAVSAVGIVVVDFALIWLAGNMLHLPGVGELVTTPSAVLANLTASLGGRELPASTAASMPAVSALYALAIGAGLMAGFTINGLFAFGEEYGWRGVLMDELAPLGPVRANLVTGVLWGLWHAPLIVLGFNYGVHRIAGVIMMCVWLLPLSFLLWRTREYCGSVLSAAVVHGAFNGSAGFFFLLVARADRLYSAPVGLLGAVGVALVAAAVWALTRGRLVTPLGRETAGASA